MELDLDSTRPISITRSDNGKYVLHYTDRNTYIQKIHVCINQKELFKFLKGGMKWTL